MTRVLAGAAEPDPLPGPQLMTGPATTTSSSAYVLYLAVTEHIASQDARGPLRVQAEVGRPVREIGQA